MVLYVNKWAVLEVGGIVISVKLLLVKVFLLNVTVTVIVKKV